MKGTAHDGPEGAQTARASGSSPTSRDLSEAIRWLNAALMDLNGALSRELRVGSAGLAALARWPELTTGAVTALLDRLAQRGCVVREPDPSDRRRLKVHITPHATEELLGHVLPLSRDIESVADGFSADERLAIGRFLDELTAVVKRHAHRDEPSRLAQPDPEEGPHVDKGD